MGAVKDLEQSSIMDVLEDLKAKIPEAEDALRRIFADKSRDLAAASSRVQKKVASLASSIGKRVGRVGKRLSSFLRKRAWPKHTSKPNHTSKPKHTSKHTGDKYTG